MPSQRRRIGALRLEVEQLARLVAQVGSDDEHEAEQREGERDERRSAQARSARRARAGRSARAWRAQPARRGRAGRARVAGRSPTARSAPRGRARACRAQSVAVGPSRRTTSPIDRGEPVDHADDPHREALVLNLERQEPAGARGIRESRRHDRGDRRRVGRLCRAEARPHLGRELIAEPGAPGQDVRANAAGPAPAGPVAADRQDAARDRLESGAPVRREAAAVLEAEGRAPRAASPAGTAALSTTGRGPCVAPSATGRNASRGRLDEPNDEDVVPARRDRHAEHPPDGLATHRHVPGRLEPTGKLRQRSRREVAPPAVHCPGAALAGNAEQCRVLRLQAKHRCRPGGPRHRRDGDEQLGVLAQHVVGRAPRRRPRRARPGAGSSGRAPANSASPRLTTRNTAATVAWPGFRASESAARRAEIGPRRPARSTARSTGASRRAPTTAATSATRPGSRSRKRPVPLPPASACVLAGPRVMPITIATSAPTAATSAIVTLTPPMRAEGARSTTVISKVATRARPSPTRSPVEESTE